MVAMNVKVKNKDVIRKFARKFPGVLDEQISSGVNVGLQKIKRDTPVKTGKARRSIIKKKKDALQYVITGSRGKGSKYLTFLEYGTGIYGPKKKPITPKTSTYLHFPIIKGNRIVRFVKTKSVKGFPPFKMFRNNMDAIKEVTMKKIKNKIKKMWGNRLV
jgi:hypothetical protein